MPTKVSFATVPFAAEALETVPFPLDENNEIWDAYPYPYLRRTGRQTQTSIRVARLENDWVLYEFAIDLGGRLWRIFDKRTSTEIGFGPLLLSDSWSRGVASPTGLQWWVEGEPFSLGLGPVDATLLEAEEPSDPALLRMHCIDPGWDFSLHTIARLNPDSAVLELEFKAANRSITSARPQLGIGLVLGEAVVALKRDAAVVFSEASRTGVAMFGVDAMVGVKTVENGVLVEFLDETGSMGPRMTASGQIQIVPFSGIPMPTGVSADACLALQGDQIWVQAAKKMPNTYIVVEDTTLDVFPVQANLDPMSIWEQDMPYARGAALITAAGKTICETFLDDERTSSIRPATIDLGWEEDVDECTIRRYLLNRPGWQGIARYHLAIEEAARSNWAEAARLSEEALLYQGDDVLTWWFRAACLEEMGEDATAELENAHFLSPCEPILRAEAFLRQKGVHSKDPSPLLSAWRNDPSLFVEVGVRLIESKLYERAARWLDEAWRNRPHALLAIQMAHLHLVHTNMEIEARRWLDLAAKQPIEPPFPCRQLERVMIEELLDSNIRHPALLTWYLFARWGIPVD